MELYHLRSFVAVANEGHLTRAAKRLFTSQPAVSAHIKALEEELGVVLFTRTSKGMILTKEGQVLKAQAEKSLNTINELFQQAKLLQDELAGSVKIGLNASPDFLKVGELFSVMTEQYPGLEFHLLHRFSWEILDELSSEQLDAGYVFGDVTSPEIRAIPLRTCNLIIVGPIDWKTRLEQADLAEIAGLPWICVSDRCPFCKVTHKVFQKQNLTPAKVLVSVNQEPTLKTLVASGAGLTAMLEEDVLVAEQEGKIVRWDKEKFEIDLSFVYLQKREEDPVIQAILQGISLIWSKNVIPQDLRHLRE
jgi:DNA-binding transcriptional LysR family regulator